MAVWIDRIDIDATFYAPCHVRLGPFQRCQFACKLKVQYVGGALIYFSAMALSGALPNPGAGLPPTGLLQSPSALLKRPANIQRERWTIETWNTGS